MDVLKISLLKYISKRKIDFIFHYVKGVPLVINVYDTNNVLGDILLEKIIKKDLKDLEYVNSNLKYYYEIVNII